MRKIIFLLLVFPLFVNAQISKSLGDFTKVTSFDQISVFLIASTENKIEISGSNAESVELIYVDNELKIRMPLDKLLRGNDILAKVYYTKLEAVEANEGSNIGCDSPISSINFDIIVKEASNIKLKIDSKRVTARVTQGGKLDIIGKADNLDVVVNAGSLLNAEKCQADQAIVAVNAGGQANVNASKLVDAKVRAGGIINIFGKPKQVNQKTILGGDIVFKN
ncbi:MAG: head GIN domain-containing protein [Bacteroidota bacterium]